jgi:uncharacterized Zn finger protein (UPF0148 family)
MVEDGARGYKLTDSELAEHLITCPRCGDPAFIDQGDDGLQLVYCAECGFNAGVGDVVNMPAEWVKEAVAEDAVEEVRENALELLESGDAEKVAVGEALLAHLDAGAQDKVAGMRLTNALRRLGGLGASRAVDSLRRLGEVA